MTDLHFRFGGYQKPKSVHTQAGAFFGEALKARLGDRIDYRSINDITFTGNKPEILAGRETGDLITLTKSGDLTFCYMSTTYFADVVPEIMVLDLPFIFEDRNVAYDLIDGELGGRLRNNIETANPELKLLGFWDNGFRHFTNRVRPIRTPADCAGIRMRRLSSPLYDKIFSALGFDPVPLNIRIFLENIEKDQVDGHDNPLTNIYNFDVHKHHPYITLTGHTFGFAGFYCNRAGYESWPPDIRQAVDDAAAETTREQRKMAASEDTDILEKLESSEAEIITLSEEERAAFIAAASPIIDEQREIIGDELMDMVCPAS